MRDISIMTACRAGYETIKHLTGEDWSGSGYLEDCAEDELKYISEPTKEDLFRAIEAVESEAEILAEFILNQQRRSAN